MSSFRPVLVIATWILTAGVFCASVSARACLKENRCDMAVLSVSNTAEFYTALSSARGGDTIELASGNYGDLKLGTWTAYQATYAPPLVITSADVTDQASFTGLDLQGVENITFENVTFDYVFEEGDPAWISPFTVASSHGVTFSNCDFDGDLAQGTGTAFDGYAIGSGLTIRDSSDITLEGNEIREFGGGITFLGSENVTVIDNEISAIRSDGLAFNDVHNVLIEGNYIHDFATAPESGDHADMIQFYTAGADTPSSNIVIRGNVLDIGNSGWTQSIFMGNEAVSGGAGVEMYYQNVLIEDNAILNGHNHGISVGAADGLNIRNNTVLSIDTSNPSFFGYPALNVSDLSLDVTIERNVVGEINGYEGQADWIVSNNAMVQNYDSELPGYYDNIYLTSSLNGPISDYVVAPGSLPDIMNAGTSMHYADTSPMVVTPMFAVATSSEDSNVLVFDASYTLLPNGYSLPDVEFNWTFSDGSTATGQVVMHSFEQGGYYDATLQVVSRGGTSVTASANVAVAGTDVLTFNSIDGYFYLHGYGSLSALAGSDTVSVPNSGQMAVDLGGQGSALSINRQNLENFFDSEAFELSITLQADQPGNSWGEVLRVHPVFVVTVAQNGELQILLSDDTGTTTVLTTAGIRVNDGAAHDIIIRFDDSANSLDVMVDGAQAGSGTVLGSMPVMQWWGMEFGNPWGGQNFDGRLLAFDLNAESNDYAVFSGVVPEPDVFVPTDGNDTLNGSIDDDAFRGGKGDDELDGGDGNDWLYGNQGQDLLLGSAGNDWIHGGNGDDSIEGGDGADTLNGGNQNDILRGGLGNDEMYGGKGDDALFGSEGDDLIFGGLGDDSIRGGGDNDIIKGASGNDTLFGNEGIDLILGGEGDDWIHGGDGNDRIEGGDDADTLNGGEGDDILIGGNGEDEFVFAQNAGHDEISDFEDDVDVIDLRDFSLDSVVQAMSFATQQGNDVLFDFGNQDTLIVLNVHTTDLGDDLLLY